MSIPITFLENLVLELPNANEYVGVCFQKDFIYQGHYFQINFYPVSNGFNEPKFWLYNQSNVRPVCVNNSYKVLS
jgi:hypothetical protein